MNAETKPEEPTANAPKTATKPESPPRKGSRTKADDETETKKERQPHLPEGGLNCGPRPSFQCLLEAYLDQVDPSGFTWKERLVDMLVQKAVEGDVRSLQEIWTRLEGKAGSSLYAPPPPLDDETACLVLKAVCDDDDELPPD
jgi:hypothetical protein